MLMQWGPLQFDVVPFNAHAVEHQAATDFARHEVIGRRAVLEHMGEGKETYRTSGKLFPFQVGGRSSLTLAHSLRVAASPHVMVWGNGDVSGWFVVTEIQERAQRLAPNGTGYLIEVDVTFERADSPTAAGYFAALYSLIG